MLNRIIYIFLVIILLKTTYEVKYEYEFLKKHLDYELKEFKNNLEKELSYVKDEEKYSYIRLIDLDNKQDNFKRIWVFIIIFWALFLIMNKGILPRNDILIFIVLIAILWVIFFFLRISNETIEKQEKKKIIDEKLEQIPQIIQREIPKSCWCGKCF